MRSQGRVAVLSLLLSFSLSSYAATLGDQFELAKTKLLFHLSAGNFEQAKNLIQTQTPVFSTTVYQDRWLYWESVVLARAGQSEEAIKLLDQLPDGVDDRQRHEYANLLIQQGAYEQALVRIEPVDDDEARYLKALSYTELGQPERAVLLLNRHQPPYQNWTRIGLPVERWAYLQAVAAVRSDNPALAQRSVAWLQNSGADAYQDEAQQLALELQQRGSRSYWVNVTASGAWDSNPTLAQAPEADLRAAIQANAGAVLLEKLRLDYLGYLSQHAEVTSANLFHNQLSIDYLWSLGAWQVQPGYRFSLSYLDNEPWQSRHMAALNAVREPFSIFAAVAGLETQTDERQWSVQGGAQYTMPQPFVFDGQLTLAGSVQHRLVDDDTEAFTQAQVDLKYDVQQGSWRYASIAKLGVLSDGQAAEPSYGANLHVFKRLTPQWQSGLLLDVTNQPDLSTGTRYQRAVATVQIRWSL